MLFLWVLPDIWVLNPNIPRQMPSLSDIALFSFGSLDQQRDPDCRICLCHQRSNRQILNPESSEATEMLIFAIVGVLANGYATWKMDKGKTLNGFVISWHLVEDVLGWVAILIVSIVLHFKDIPYLDPALSLLITIYILWNVVIRLKETLVIILQVQPTDVDSELIEKEILNIEQVESIHYTQIWSLDGEHHVFTTHLKLGAIKELGEMLLIKNRVKEVMKKYPFEQYTIETEIDSELCGLEGNVERH